MRTFIYMIFVSLKIFAVMAQSASSSSPAIRHILVTGQPGAGKTTLLRRACELLLQQSAQMPCFGFYTEEVRGNAGSRIGFDIVTLNGKSRTALARIKAPTENLLFDGATNISHGVPCQPSEFTTSPSAALSRVGQYNVFVDEFERVALSLFTNIQTPCICVIDEIGKMELFSNKFKQLIRTLLEKPNLILIATIPIKPLAFVDDIRRRNDCHLMTVTRENRAGLALRNELMVYIEELKKNLS